MRYNDDIPSFGLGIKILGQIADELSYTRNCDRRNFLTIVKYFQPVLSQYTIQTRGLKQASEVLKIFNCLKEQKTY